MGPGRFPRYGVATSPAEWFSAWEAETRGSPGETVVAVRVERVPQSVTPAAGGSQTPDEVPGGDPGCTTARPRSGRVEYADGSVYEWTD